MRTRLPVSYVHPSVPVGDRLFCGRGDYEAELLAHGDIESRDALWSNDLLVKGVHRHWHERGQNGCVFAQTIASTAQSTTWESAVVRGELTASGCTAITQMIGDALDNPDCEILSLLFPEITATEQLLYLIQRLISSPMVMLGDEYQVDGLTALALRVRVDRSRSLAWLMGFGPFGFLPRTRRSPITEIAIRTKSKPTIRFWRLSGDVEAAHLADFPIGIPPKQMEHLWLKTKTRTRAILGGEPNALSAAKVTFAIPSGLWNRRIVTTIA